MEMIKLGRKKDKKKKHIFRKFLLIILLILVVFAGSFVGYSVYKNGWGFQSLLATALGQDEETLQNLDTINVLLLRC